MSLDLFRFSYFKISGEKKEMHSKYIKWKGNENKPYIISDNYLYTRCHRIKWTIFTFSQRIFKGFARFMLLLHIT